MLGGKTDHEFATLLNPAERSIPTLQHVYKAMYQAYLTVPIPALKAFRFLSYYKGLVGR